ncbi:MAG TPA: SLC13 family permease, partial [Spirochaetia bacterium]|nr:SLC13 family permease [Spirochaetia bacterium]
KYTMPLPPIDATTVRSFVPSIIVVLLIASLIAASTLFHSVRTASGLVCIIYGSAAAVWYFRAIRPPCIKGQAQANNRLTLKALLALDWQTAVFLVGVFVLVGSLSSTGAMDTVARAILTLSGSNPLFVFVLIVAVSVAVSAFVDNVPFLVAMLPVVQAITTGSGLSPYLLDFGLLLGASVGGNITPIGASANIVAFGIVKREGYVTRFFDFVKIGFPFTMVAVIASSVVLWFVFS